MEEMYCQSCGMPLVKAEDFATNKDGTPMSEYCIYCFKDGDFTGDITMEDMINISLKHMYRNEVTLPLHTRLTDEDIDYVLTNFTEILSK